MNKRRTNIQIILPLILVNGSKNSVSYGFAQHILPRNPEKIKNLNVLVEEDLESGEVIFLRKSHRLSGFFLSKTPLKTNEISNDFY